MTESTTALKPVTFVRDLVGDPYRPETDNKLWLTQEGKYVTTSYAPPNADQPGETMVFPAHEDGSPNYPEVFKDGPFGEFFEKDRWVYGEDPLHTEALATLGYMPAEEDTHE